MNYQDRLERVINFVAEKHNVCRAELLGNIKSPEAFEAVKEAAGYLKYDYGLGYRQIAAILNVSQHTIQGYFRNKDKDGFTIKRI